jgi:hypothetical protein
LNPDTDTDPDPSFQVNQDPVPDPVFWRPKIQKKISWKCFPFFWSKIAITLLLGLLKERPSYRRILQPSKENIQHLKKWNLLTPGSESRDHIESGSTTLVLLLLLWFRLRIYLDYVKTGFRLTASAMTSDRITRCRLICKGGDNIKNRPDILGSCDRVVNYFWNWKAPNQS